MLHDRPKSRLSHTEPVASSSSSLATRYNPRVVLASRPTVVHSNKAQVVEKRSPMCSHWALAKVYNAIQMRDAVEF